MNKDETGASGSPADTGIAVWALGNQSIPGDQVTAAFFTVSKVGINPHCTYTCSQFAELMFSISFLCCLTTSV